MRSFALVAACCAIFAAAPAAATNITGQSATAAFNSGALASFGSQFTSPAVIGPGTEFTGSFVDVFGQNWGIGLDMTGAGFTLTIGESTLNGVGNIRSTGNALAINITGLSGLAGTTLASYACASAGPSCSAFGGGSALTSLTSTADSIALNLGVIRDGETYVFALSAVPEPASWAMLIAGFGLTGAAMRRRRPAMASA
jgi:hypothetical protein